MLHLSIVLAGSASLDEEHPLNCTVQSILQIVLLDQLTESTSNTLFHCGSTKVFMTHSMI
ncbi:hypothetical protein FKM82_024372 [Ascaphus truei]